MSGFRIAFVSGKLGDVDGVSLEVDKWISILNALGHDVYTIAGFYRQPVRAVSHEKQILLPQIAFDSKEQRYYETLVFPHLTQKHTHFTERRKEDIRNELEAAGLEVGNRLYEIIQEYRIDCIIAENTNAMPMSLLGGIAVHAVATMKRVATIFHHHDFWWERSRFCDNIIETLLNRIMPPSDLGTEHVVISSYASHILSSIKRVNPVVIPNCEDFSSPHERDSWNEDFRQEMGFTEEDILIVQPTRIVPRKRIEDSVRLVARFKEAYPQFAPHVQFIVSLYQGDELDHGYIEGIKRLARELDVPLWLISDRIASQRTRNAQGQKLYTTRDVLVHADLATYLPVWEGFGNAFLEAVSCRVPIITTTYLVYKTDIQSVGFQALEIRDKYDENGLLIITDQVVQGMRTLLEDEDERKEVIEQNFLVGQQEFGFEVLERKLCELLEGYSDEIRASRRRLEKSLASYSV
ncbi:MAG: glycosyltransferase family 4 protein [Spirochaetales bacterium]|nr:glycosyltransferase family 4 protein [Spirochaetales bacterium]